jgi:hypothetical protein
MLFLDGEGEKSDMVKQGRRFRSQWRSGAAPLRLATRRRCASKNKRGDVDSHKGAAWKGFSATRAAWKGFRHCVEMA